MLTFFVFKNYGLHGARYDFIQMIGCATRTQSARIVSRLSLGKVPRATACILAVLLLRTSCHHSWMLVTAWSYKVSVPVSRSGDHTAPSLGDTGPGHSLRDRTFATRADTEARLAIQGQTVADLDRRIAQIDAAVEESTRLGRPVGAMTIADRKRRNRADIVAARQREAEGLAGLQIEKARIDAQRRRAEAEVGPVRYLAELIGTPATDLERPVRLLTLALVAVLDPLAVALLLAAGTHTRRVGSH